MTVEMFLDALKSTKRAWSVKAGALRLKDGHTSCPITSLEGWPNPEGAHAAVYMRTAVKLGIDPSFAREVASAADSDLAALSSFAPKLMTLRERLLEACGLGAQLKKEQAKIKV